MKNNASMGQLLASDKSWLTISNGLTLLRLLLAPVIVISLYHQSWLLAFGLFMVAAATDFFDGYVARSLGQQTQLGTLLDPVADKCLLISVFGALSFFKLPFLQVPPWFFLIIVGREVLMVLGSIILLRWCKGVHVQPMMWGKLTTVLQILFIMWVFVCYFAGWEPRKTFMVVLVLLTLFSLLSLHQYATRAVSDVQSPGGK